MGLRGYFHLISVTYFNYLLEGKEPESEEDEMYDLNGGSWYWLHEVFKHQKPPLNKTITGDYIPKVLDGNTIDLFQTKGYWDFYCGLASPQLIIEIVQELSFITEATWQNWCRRQKVKDAWFEDLGELKYIYSRAAEQQKSLMIIIS